MAMADSVINIFIVVLLAGILLPLAFSQIFNANVVGWDTNTKTVFKLLPIISVVALIVVLVYAYYARGQG